jgi:hypothetical protein
MSKSISDDLFYLIGSMSKSEKRHFKLSYVSDKHNAVPKFIVLFDAIVKQKKYNEEKILKSNKSLKPLQLPNLKIHLYDRIMHSLVQVNATGNIEIRIYRLLSLAQILYHKCLYEQSFKILKKAADFSIMYSLDNLLLENYDLQKKIMIHTLSTRSGVRIAAITDASLRLSRQLSRSDYLSNLSLRLNAFYLQQGFIRNKSDYTSVKEFYERNLPKGNYRDMCSNEKIFYLLCQSGYHYYIQNFVKGKEESMRLYELFEKNPNLIQARTETFIKALNNVLVGLNKLGEYELFVQYHKKLLILKRNRKLKLPQNANLNLFKTYYIHEINRHFMLGEFTAGTKIVGRLESELNRFIKILDQHTLLIFYYKIACLYFGASQFRQALKWLNKITLYKESGLREDIHVFARIISLICHYELEHDELLEAAVKNTYRYVLMKEDLNQYQKNILSFLRDLQNIQSEKELKLRFKILKRNMEKLKEHAFERRPFLYFDIISWLESKINGEKVEIIIRNKLVRNT